MDTLKFLDKGQVKMIAHRGVSGLETENTLPAFILACQGSHYGIETDVRATKDGRFVLFHDDSLQRLLGMDKLVSDCDFTYLRSLRFCKDGKARDDLFIPTPEEYFDLCKRYRKHAVFELKPGLSAGQVCALVDLVRDFGWLDNTTFISFDFPSLLTVKDYCPQTDVYFLAGDIPQEIETQMLEKGIHADVQYATLSKERVARYKAQGIKINCWTVDDLTAAKTLKDWGVDFITSNIIE